MLFIIQLREYKNTQGAIVRANILFMAYRLSLIFIVEVHIKPNNITNTPSLLFYPYELMLVVFYRSLQSRMFIYVLNTLVVGRINFVG